jgi:hypothetical protein
MTVLHVKHKRNIRSPWSSAGSYSGEPTDFVSLTVDVQVSAE